MQVLVFKLDLCPTKRRGGWELNTRFAFCGQLKHLRLLVYLHKVKYSLNGQLVG